MNEFSILHGYRVKDAIARGGNTVVIGESYGKGSQPDTDLKIKSWVDYLKEYHKGNYFTSCEDGIGFDSENCWKTFNTQLTELITTMSDTEKEMTSLVIVGGGYNDRFVSEATLHNSLSDFKTIVKTNFPNAKIKIFGIGWCVQDLMRLKVHEAYSVFAKICGMYDMSFEKIHALHDYSLFTTDNVHPNEEGEKLIASSIASSLNGNYRYSVPWQTVTLTNSENVVSGNIQLGIAIEGDNAFLRLGETVLTLNNIEYTGNGEFLIATYENKYLNGFVGGYCSIPVSGFIVLTDNTALNISGVIILDSGNMKFYSKYVHNNTFFNGNIKSIALSYGHSMLPSYLV